MILIPFIYFSILFVYLAQRHKGIDVSAYMVLLYAFSSLFAILIDVRQLYDANGVCAEMPFTFGATVSYCALLTLSIIPFSRMRSTSLKQINITKTGLYDALSWLFIITFFLTFLMLSRDIYSVIMSSDLSEVRSAIYAGEEGNKSLGIRDLEWWLILPNTLFSQFSPIAILFFYINITNKRKSNLFNYILLLSSITPILSAILIAGRSQIIYWVLSYGFCYFLFYRQMDKQQKKVVLRPFIVLAGAMVVFFASVTLSRFSTFSLDSNTNTFNSVVAYVGQPFINYNNFFNNYICNQHTYNRLFPVSHYFVLDPKWTLGDYRALIQSQTGMNIGVFYTFLGDLMVDIDKSGMLIFVLLFAIAATYLSRQEEDNTIPVYRMLLIQLLALIPLQGIFYYSFHRVDVGYYIIGTIFLSILFKYTLKRS